MALSSFQPNLLTSFSSSSYPSNSLLFISLQPLNHSSKSFKCLCSSHHTVQVDTQEIKLVSNTAKTKRKPRPSFLEQIQDRWSYKIGSPRQKFPWQVQELESQKQEEEEEEDEEEEEQSEPCSRTVDSDSKIDGNGSVSEQVSFVPSHLSILAPWSHGSQPRKTQIDSGSKISKDRHEKVQNSNGFFGHCENNVTNSIVEGLNNFENNDDCDGKIEEEVVKLEKTPIGLLGDDDTLIGDGIGGFSLKEKQSGNVEVAADDKSSSIGLPWKSDRWRRSKTVLAEKLIPEHELKRLKNVALRMMERIKVGKASITQEVVTSIHEKWQNDEVVKLKFEGPPTLNMKRTHEILENKTGGVVIWRSGSSIVLYRGMSYKLHCVQSYTKQNNHHMGASQNLKDTGSDVTQTDLVRSKEPLTPSSARYMEDLSEEELIEINELNHLFDELGPRYLDWSGREPLPVDADMLPPLVPGYKPPVRLLPHGTRHCLRNKEMTSLRRLARTMPPHFALGRNRELQGLARAIVKLWGRSDIAKIAIKRGVLNTLNERMAEEIKKLTGGTLLSRNKDYIVFYRGNDFMPPAVMEALKERQKQTEVCQDEEEQVRQGTSALLDSKVKSHKRPLVAGTLAETLAATSHWGRQASSEDIENMMRESSLARHASLVRYLEKKLALAKQKMKKAEKALSKVQENLEPAELPNDLESLSDEERFLFRKMGLSMKPFLLLGTRGVFDGTIENMHLHWKFRELVKIIVRGKNFAQVKHIAISLEAESGGVIVSLDKTTKGYAIIVYRGKNYQRPLAMRPRNLLTRRQALARSIELQRREALKHHILDLEEQIELLKSGLEEMKSGKKIDEQTLYTKLKDAAYTSNDDMEKDEGEEAYLEIYESSDEDSNAHKKDLKLEL